MCMDWLKKPVDLDRLLPLLAKTVAHEANRRPRILHVDEDNSVARALGEIGDVVTVNSIEEARQTTEDERLRPRGA